MKRVLVTEPMHDVGLSLLRDRADIEVIHAEDAKPETLARLVPGVHGIAVRTAALPATLLASANELQVVSRHGVGCDNVDVAHLTARNIPVAIASGANSSSVSEHTLAMVLTLSRRLMAVDAAVRDNNWQARGNLIASDLEGAVMVIIGFGRVGRKVAPLARAFGMEVVVVDIALDRELADSMGCRGVEDFRPELANADFVTLHVPLDDSTHHMISAAEFNMMKPGSVLINCARGGVIDEAALLAALQSGHLAGAGLDVFSVEPPPADDAAFCGLIQRDDVIMAPHTGAASHGAMQEMSRMAMQNILDCFDGTLKPDCVFNHAELAGR
ncbi:MAG: hydroxyacid dehydrogenase [Rhodospirillaceae bacterium]|nr:hydroxyacid dehydrogenase [Rhodospirillaceae bacterium]